MSKEEKLFLKRKESLLKMLIEDVRIFGPAGNDVERISELKREIKKLKKELI